MPRLHWPIWLVSAILMLALTGCGTPRAGGLNLRQGAADFSSRSIPDTTVAAVRPVAVRVFRQHYRLDEEASVEDTLISRPAEMPGRGESRQLRDRISLTPSRQRQVSELRLRQQGSGVLIQVTVQNQRMDTAERASFARAVGDDRPGVTPIDQQGFTSAAPREDWVNIGRDRHVEQEMLSAISETFATSAPGE